MLMGMAVAAAVDILVVVVDNLVVVGDTQVVVDYLIGAEEDNLAEVEDCRRILQDMPVVVVVDMLLG